MTASAQKFTFTKITTGTSNVSQEINITGVTSTVKCLWLYAIPVTANNTYNNGFSWSYGFSDGTDDACVAAAAQDNVTTSACGAVIRSDNVICLLDPASPQTVLCRATVTSFDSDGVTLNWVVNNNQAYIIHGMVIFGTDFTNVKVVNTSLEAGGGGTGTENYTGFGFSGGDFMQCLTGIDVQTYNTITDNGECIIGTATSATKRWVLGGHSQPGQGTIDSYHVYMNNNVCTCWDFGTGDIRMVGDFVAFITDGVQFTWDSAPINDGPLSILMINGGVWDCGDFAGNNTTNNQVITLAGGQPPALFAIFSANDTVADTGPTVAASNYRISVGAADSGNDQGCIFVGDQDGAGVSVTAMISKTDALIRTAVENATATSTVTTGECTIFDMATTNEVEIDWTDATNERFAWFSVGQSAPATIDMTNTNTKTYSNKFITKV